MLDTNWKQQCELIIKNNTAQSLQAMDQFARSIGDSIAGQQQGNERRNGVTTSQIRGIFGTVRLIEQDINPAAQDSDELPISVLRQLTLLKPKLKYQYARISDKDKTKKALAGELTDVLVECIDLVIQVANHAAFQNFVDFFEAILAYHRYYGGKNN